MTENNTEQETQIEAKPADQAAATPPVEQPIQPVDQSVAKPADQAAATPPVEQQNQQLVDKQKFSEELEQKKLPEQPQEDVSAVLKQQSKMIKDMSQKLEVMEREKFMGEIAGNMSEETAKKFKDSVEGLSLNATKNFYNRVKDFIPAGDVKMTGGDSFSAAPKAPATEAELEEMRRRIYGN